VSAGAEHRRIAWNRELIAAHGRLRAAFRVVRESVDGGPLSRHLRRYGHGFCAALSGHHEREDAGLFSERVARHPSLPAQPARRSARC